MSRVMLRTLIAPCTLEKWALRGQAENCLGTVASLPQVADTGRAVPLGQALAVRATQQTVMCVGRFLPAHQGLQQPVDCGGRT